MECHWRIAFENSENGTGFIFFFWLNSQYSLGLILSPRSYTSNYKHINLTPYPPPLHSCPTPSPLCAIKWNIHDTFKDDQISSYRPCLIAESGWKRRCQSPAPHPSYHWNPTTWLNTKFDCTYTHTLTHSHTHTLTHSHTLPLSQTHSHPITFSRRNARACGGACYTLEACMNYLQLKG